MDEVDKVILHYQMLEYLFNKCKLATSYFNHTWEVFLSEHPEYKNSLTASELKSIFWTEIAKNIDQYELLTEEQQEYFSYDLCISDENLLKTFEHIEPRIESDYLFLKTQENHRRLVPQRTRVTEQSVQNVFKEPNVCTKENDIKLNIIGTKESSELDVKNEFKLSCLLMNLFTDDELINNEHVMNIEILNRLRNPNLCIDIEHLRIESDDWSKAIYGEPDKSNTNSTEDLSLMLNIPKSTINSSQSNESLRSASNSQSSLSILLPPQISRTPTRSMTRSLSQTTPTSQTRRQIIQSSSKSSTPSRSTRSRRALVPDPALNLKMSKFMEKHERRNK